MSLNQRINLSASIVLLIFITLTAAALNRAFVESSENALRDQLTSQLYALMAAADVSENGITMPSNELDALLGLPSSGIYAIINRKDGQVMWQSSSVLGATPPPPLVLDSGVKRFITIDEQPDDYFQLAYGVNWALDNDGITDYIPLTFNIISDLSAHNEQLQRYRTTLWGWLLAMALLLLVTQAAILRWGLSPLRQVSAEISKIENGTQERIQKPYPREIERLTDNINQLLQQEREQKTRYRNALGDLAHSLKTPLAVLQSNLEQSNPKLNSHEQRQPESDSGDNTASQQEVMQQQLNRMNSIVEYQLQRAATAGAGNIGQMIRLKNLVERIVDSLQKVYRDKKLEIHVMIGNDISINADEGDLMELLGNLLDNACKWARSSIEISYSRHQDKHEIRITDDGPGIKAEQVENLLQRGVRADQATAGHGIGLSIVRNIIDAYDGDLQITTGPPGGAQVIITL
jgi:two-component system, OmpR family, sensor histidine kinase PhoQ